MENKIRILVVDDEEHTRLGYAEVLRLEGYSVETAANGKEALNKMKEEDFDVVVTDLRMPEMDGLSFVSQLRDISPNQKVIIITAFGTFKAYKQSKEAGVTFIFKQTSKGKGSKGSYCSDS